MAITFEEFAKTHPLEDADDWGRYTHYFSLTRDGVPIAGWRIYRVKRFNSRFPEEFCAGHCDILAALQAWIEGIPALAALLVVEQPLVVGGDFYVTPNHSHPTTLFTFDNVDQKTYPPDAPLELAAMRQVFRDAVPRFTEPRERLLIGILERELFPPDNMHTWFDEDVPLFSVMDVTTTYEEIDTWLDHEEWWVHPAVEPPPAPPPAPAPAR